MGFSPIITFKNLKSHIADAIKESCYKTDARFYKVANDVHNIVTKSVEPGVELADGLSKVVDKTIKESVALDCDLSVIVKGILLGAFRSRLFIAEEAHSTIRQLVKEILKSIFKYKGDVKQSIEGALAAIVIVANEYNLPMSETLVAARGEILLSAKELDPKFADNIQKALSNPDDSSPHQ